MYQALIIEDDQQASRYLTALLASHPAIMVKGTAGNVKDAAELVKKEKPDLLFLDVELGG